MKEVLIGKKIDYLDKGYVTLVDVLGSDELVCAAARQSFDNAGEQKTYNQNQGLINYLTEHRHSSPQEIPKLVFEIKLPIFVMRQHVRHRTACLAGDTVVTFLDKNGTTSPKARKTIEEVFDQWENGQIDGNPNSKTGRRCMKKRIRKQRVRVLNEEDDLFEIGHIKNVYFNGVEPVYLVSLEDGKSVKMTLNHRVYTSDGWQTLGDAVGWTEKLGVTKTARLATNGQPVHQNKKWMAAMRKKGVGVQAIADAAGCSYHTIRKWLKIHDLRFTRKETANLTEPWNKGLSGYKLDVTFTDERLATLRDRQSGENCNFWKGGASTEREKIGAWTSRQLPRLADRCEICGTDDDLVCHHVVPVSVDISLARDINNLAAVCRGCHSELHSTPAREWESAIFLRPDLMNGRDRHTFRSNKAGYRLTTEYSKILSVEYAGEEKVYDLEMEGPWHNFVANGIVVHNSLNEQSLRYSEHSGEYYLPPVERFCKSHKWNKQGSGEPLSEHVAEACQQMYAASCEEQLSTYHKMLNAGVSKETARGVLGVSFYTKITWAMDLRNLFHYLGLRNEGHAQQEIQELAAIIENEFVAPLFPKSYAAYLEFVKGSETFSKTEADWLRGFLKRYAQAVPKELFEELSDTRPEEFTSERRWQQFLEKIKFTP